jgi:signal transduction histidine kinase
VAVSVQLELLGRKLSGPADGVRELLDQTRQLVQDSLAEARRSIWDLRSQTAEREDFASKLSKTATQITSRTTVKLRFEVNGTYHPLSEKIEDELLRIGQEAITNVVRHAEAKHIEVSLSFDAKKVRMTITDDGRGFADQGAASSANGHYGLQGMRERAEQIGAELIVASTPGAGTQVRVETPIHR